jgi:hypothetical protein
VDSAKDARLRRNLSSSLESIGLPELLVKAFLHPHIEKRKMAYLPVCDHAV